MSDDGAIGRREFVSTALLAAAGGGLSTTMRTSDVPAFVGTYTTDGRSDGIHRIRVDLATGSLRLDGLAVATVNPSFLAFHPSGRVLYAVNEIAELNGQPTGAVSAFAVDAQRRLALLDQVPSHGAGPAHLSLDRAGRVALVANYGAGSVATIPLRANGGLGTARSVVQHRGHGADPTRQAGPHAHCVVADPANRFVLVVDLGLDAVLSYRFDADTGGIAVVEPGYATARGAGPRHLAFHPVGDYAYLVNELDSTVSALRYDPATGALAEIATVPASPDGTGSNNHPAEVVVSPSGRTLYVSNRGDDTIAVFSIDLASGTLSPVQHVSSGGRAPRHFAIDPSGRCLVVANQRSDALTSLRIDPDTGRLAATGSTLAIANPVCVLFA